MSKMKTFNAWSAYANHPIKQMKNVVTEIPCGQLPAKRFYDPIIEKKLNKLQTGKNNFEKEYLEKRDEIFIKYKTRAKEYYEKRDEIFIQYKTKALNYNLI